MIFLIISPVVDISPCLVFNYNIYMSYYPNIPKGYTIRITMEKLVRVPGKRLPLMTPSPFMVKLDYCQELGQRNKVEPNAFVFQWNNTSQNFSQIITKSKCHINFSYAFSQICKHHSFPLQECSKWACLFSVIIKIMTSKKSFIG